jgi:predicted hydrocarbon binding protein/predicted amino acid-binding ACT domain protein
MFRRLIVKRGIPRRYREEEGIPNLYLDTVFYSYDKPLSLIIVKAKNVPGAIHKITSVLAERNINILKINVPEIATENYGFVIILIEQCVDKCLEDVINTIKNKYSDIIMDIKGVSSTNSYVFLKYGKLLFLDSESFILTLKMLEKAIYELYSGYGMGSLGAVTLLTTIGRGNGKAIYEDYVRPIIEGSEESYEEKIGTALEMFKYIYKALGLGEMIINTEMGVESTYEIIINDNFECTAIKKHGSGHGFVGKTGHVTMGILSGFFESLFGRVAVVEERECINEGAETDVFVVSLRESIYPL